MMWYRPIHLDCGLSGCGIPMKVTPREPRIREERGVGVVLTSSVNCSEGLLELGHLGQTLVSC